MLNKIRSFSKTFFAKILLVIIIIPFVFWGMGGVFNTGNTNNIVKINNYSISTQDFIDHLNASNLNSDQIKENIDNNVLEEALGKLISRTLLQMEIEDLNISISEKSLIEQIKKNKNFSGDDNKFSRVKYEKFLLSNNLNAPDFEKRLKENELQKKLFSYISGGIKSPFFMTNNIYKKQTKKINLDFINLENIYKKEKDFSDDEIKFFINENKDQLKEEHLDFTYIKINPQNLIGSEEFNELFFKKIDELENNILNGVPFNDLTKELKIQPIKRTNYTLNNKNNEIEEKIYQLRNKNKIQLIEENEFYVFFEINKINKVLPNLNDNGFKSKVTRILYEKGRYEFNHELLKKINNREFNNVSFTKLTNNNSTKIENIQLLSIKDDNKFNINSIKLLYAMPVNSFSLVNDDKNNIYIARINKFFEENISKNSEQFRNYNNQANTKIRDYMYTSYDNFLNDKYKVNVNQKTLERVKNYFN